MAMPTNASLPACMQELAAADQQKQICTATADLQVSCFESTLKCCCQPGMEWRTFNMTQKQMRRDMLRLYGNKKHLIPRRMTFRASEVPSLVPFIVIQVILKRCSVGGTLMNIPAAIFRGRLALCTCPVHCQV